MPLTLWSRLPLGLALWLAVGAHPGCSDRFTEPQLLGGVWVQPEVLEAGRAVYVRECSGCHGEQGEGARAAAHNEPAPRDLREGVFKFTSLPGGGLPTDDDLIGTIREGLDGTRMVSRHDLDQSAVTAVVQFIKTFSPRWRRERQLAPAPDVADPWPEGSRSAAIARGYEVFHVEGTCWTCHTAYANISTVREIAARSSRMSRDSVEKALQAKGDILIPTLVETRFGNVLPPDFLDGRVRAAKGPRGLYRTIANGVGGTPMPAWAGRLSPKDLWAVIHYVQELVRVRGTPSAGRYRLGLPGTSAVTPIVAPTSDNRGNPHRIPAHRPSPLDIKGY